MKKTRCVHCGKELEYDGFCCPTMCKECDEKWLVATAGPIDTTVDRRYVARMMGQDKTNCLICDEEIQLTDGEFVYVLNGNHIFKVCDKCKEAVMKMRGDK